MRPSGSAKHRPGLSRARMTGKADVHLAVTKQPESYDRGTVKHLHADIDKHC